MELQWRRADVAPEQTSVWRLVRVSTSDACWRLLCRHLGELAALGTAARSMLSERRGRSGAVWAARSVRGRVACREDASDVRPKL